jgi:hypothetical protein
MIVVTRHGQYQMIMPDAVNDRGLHPGIDRGVLPDAAPGFNAKPKKQGDGRGQEPAMPGKLAGYDKA